MKRCCFSQVLALSAIYSVIAQSEQLLRQHTIRSPQSSESDIGPEQTRTDDDILRNREGDNSIADEANKQQSGLIGTFVEEAMSTRSQDQHKLLEFQPELVSQVESYYTDDYDDLTFDRIIQILNDLAGQGEESFETTERAVMFNHSHAREFLKQIKLDENHIYEEQSLQGTAQVVQDSRASDLDELRSNIVTDVEHNYAPGTEELLETEGDNFIQQLVKTLDLVIETDMLEEMDYLSQAQGHQETLQKSAFLVSDGFKNPESLSQANQTHGQRGDSDILNIVEQDLASQSEKPLMMQRTLAQQRAAADDAEAGALSQSTVSPYLVYIATPVLLFSIAAFYS